MIHYQHKKNNPYILPHHVFYQTIWTIKGYFYQKEKMEDIILATPVHDGMPKERNVPDPTASKAMKIRDAANVVRVIDEEREKIQEEYRTGVWRNIMYGERYPDDADVSTYSRHKGRFVYNVAIRLGYY